MYSFSYLLRHVKWGRLYGDFIQTLLMWNLHKRFVTKHEFENLENDVKKVVHDVTEIKAGIGLAKWAFVVAIALIPVLTTIMEEVKDGALHPEPQTQKVYLNPDGTPFRGPVYNNFTN